MTTKSNESGEDMSLVLEAGVTRDEIVAAFASLVGGPIRVWSDVDELIAADEDYAVDLQCQPYTGQFRWLVDVVIDPRRVRFNSWMQIALALARRTNGSVIAWPDEVLDLHPQGDYALQIWPSGTACAVIACDGPEDGSYACDSHSPPFTLGFPDLLADGLPDGNLTRAFRDAKHRWHREPYL